MANDVVERFITEVAGSRSGRPNAKAVILDAMAHAQRGQSLFLTPPKMVSAFSMGCVRTQRVFPRFPIRLDAYTRDLPHSEPRFQPHSNCITSS